MKVGGNEEFHCHLFQTGNVNQIKNKKILSLAFTSTPCTNPARPSVGFINPGSLRNRLPRQASAQAGSTQLMGRPKDLKQQAERAVQSPTGRSGRRGTVPAHRLLRPTSPTGALASDSSRLRTASPIRRPGPKCYFRLRPRVSDRGSQKPCSPLFSDWRDQGRLDPSDRGRPLGRNQGTNRKSKPRRTSQTMLPGTIP